MNKQTKFYLQLIQKRKDIQKDLQQVKIDKEASMCEMVQEYLNKDILIQEAKLDTINYIINKLENL
jgi:hypothetical protein